MATNKKLTPDGKRQKRAVELQQFVRAIGRTANRGSLDPNDRQVDRRMTDTVRRMRPEAFDRLLRDDDDC